MPGGKIVVYTVYYQLRKMRHRLAAVMGHEVTHAIFNHGNERMSQQMGAQAVELGLQVALANKPAATRDLFLGAYGAGAQVGVLLPFSRKHELEADRYGLIWTAMAGYQSKESNRSLERDGSRGAGSSRPPEFLSSHPMKQSA
jgi:predicted Zn-dependent protease